MTFVILKSTVYFSIIRSTCGKFIKRDQDFRVHEGFEQDIPAEVLYK